MVGTSDYMLLLVTILPGVSKLRGATELGRANTILGVFEVSDSDFRFSNKRYDHIDPCQTYEFLLDAALEMVYAALVPKLFAVFFGVCILHKTAVILGDCTILRFHHSAWLVF